MKHKGLLYKIIMVILVSLIVTLSLLIFNNQNNKKVLVIGNPITLNENIEYNDSFTSPFMSSSFLNRMLESDASKIVDDKIVKLSNLIKNSNDIFINIGLIDITSNIKENTINNTLTYDLELLSRQMQLSMDFVIQIIDKVCLINNNANIYLIKQSYPYKVVNLEIETIFNSYNEFLNNLAIERDFKYIL